VRDAVTAHLPMASGIHLERADFHHTLLNIPAEYHNRAAIPGPMDHSMVGLAYLIGDLDYGIGGNADRPITVLEQLYGDKIGKQSKGFACQQCLLPFSTGNSPGRSSVAFLFDVFS
jgi:hypothetical protein